MTQFGNDVAPQSPPRSIPDERAPELAPSIEAEFAGFLADLGAQAPEEPALDFDLRDQTIAALREMLEGLRPLGEQLALAEKARLELTAQLEAVLHATHAHCEEEVARLRTALDESRARLKRSRAKTAERHRVATQRWREIQSLRAERTRLTRELARKRAPRTDDSATA